MTEQTRAQLETLAQHLPRVTAIIGGGGKTSLLHALGEVLAQQGERVVLTTTTHLAWEAQAVSPRSAQELNEYLAAPGHALVCGDPAPNGRMTGIPVGWYDALTADHILVEADGSRHLPLKVHRPGEPVIPPGAGLTIAVAGLSALDRPVQEVVHSWQVISLAGEKPVDEALVAQLLLRGLERAPETGKKLALLNQADTPELAQRGAEIARLLSQRQFLAQVICLRPEQTQKARGSIG